jgi:hypothetical protein
MRKKIARVRPSGFFKAGVAFKLERASGFQVANAKGMGFLERGRTQVNLLKWKRKEGNLRRQIGRFRSACVAAQQNVWARMKG